MARNTRERVAFLKALALAKVLNLVGHMVVFGMFGDDGAVIVLQRLARPVAECWSSMLDGIAMALDTKIRLAVSSQTRGMHDGMCRFGFRMISWKLAFSRPGP